MRNEVHDFAPDFGIELSKAFDLRLNRFDDLLPSFGGDGSGRQASDPHDLALLRHGRSPELTYRSSWEVLSGAGVRPATRVLVQPHSLP